MDFTIVNKMITLVAKRNSGKSFLLKWLVEQYKDSFEKIFVICPTEQINSFYQRNEFIEPQYIFETYDESWCEALIAKMTRLNKGKSSEEAQHVLLIIDDVVADTSFHQSPSLKKLFIRGRHIFITVMITSQYLNAIPPIARSNSDFVCVGQLNKQGLDILSDEFIKAGMTKDEFVSIYKKATVDYSFLLINNNSVKSEDPNETYGTLKTPADFMNANK